MKVLVLSNGKFEVKEIENTLEELQKIVGGYIEIPFLGKTFNENKIDVIINEEGKFIEGLKPEIALIDEKSNRILDVVYGSCIFASHDEEGNTVGLTVEQIEIVLQKMYLDVMLAYKDTDKEFMVKALFV